MQRIYGPSAANVIGFAAPLRDRSGQAIGCWRNLATVSLVTAMLGDAARDLAATGYPGATLLVVDSTGRKLAEGRQGAGRLGAERRARPRRLTRAAAQRRERVP